MKRESCRSCGGPLTSVLDLGEICQSDFVSGIEEEVRQPLELVRCSSCDLVQLGHDYNLDTMYRQYWYKSSLNPSMLESLRDIVASARRRKVLFHGDVVVDIGANDGSLLSMYPEGVFRVGYDPAYNLRLQAEKNCDFFINDYFSAASYSKDIPRASIVTSIAMFYDLPDPNSFIADVKKILKEDGLWIVQFTDLTSMLELNAFDNICHEHLEYYSFTVLKQLMEKHGLSVFDIEVNKVNGGSIRAYICHPGRWGLTGAVRFREVYERLFYSIEDPYRHFYNSIQETGSKLRRFLNDIHYVGKTVAVLGASTKGNTLLQYYGIDHTLLSYAAEVNPDKIGLKTVGTKIPIVSEEEALRRNPDYFLVLPWHFAETFKKKFGEYFMKGGTLLFPLPQPYLLSKEGQKLL